MSAENSRWYCIPAELVDLTPEHARDLVVECFFQAQRETLERTRTAMGLDAPSDVIRSEAENAVREAFARTDGDFDNPDKQSLERAVEFLLEMAKSMGTPADIMRHHEQQIAMMLEGLGD